MSIFDNLTAQQFKDQFPRFSPQFLSEIDYINGKPYFRGNIVYFEQNFYICKVSVTSNLPVDNNDWDNYEDSVLNYTQDSDILEAYAEAKVNFNEALFSYDETALRVFLFLVAHYLTIDFNNALGTNQVGIPTSRSVGSVSESYTIPPYLQNNPALSMYCTTGYGTKYATLIYPYMIGNVMLFKGGVTIA